MDRIKIVFILGTLNMDGTQKQFLEMVRRLDRTRFSPQVLAFHEQGTFRAELEALQIPFVSVDYSGLQGKFRLKSYLQLYRLIRDMVRYIKKQRPHIVHSFLFWTNIYGSLAAKIAGTPVIITGRRSMTDLQYMKKSYTFLQNLSNLWTTAIFVNAQNIKADCLRHEQHVRSDNIHVIHNGVDITRYHPKKRDQALKRDSLLSSLFSPIIGIIGSLSRYKDHETFLKAAAMTLEKHPGVTFLVIGRDGGLLQSLKRLSKTLCIEHAVIFTGERNDIPDLLSMIDILVSSSPSEGLSNAILEGMAAGRAIVATEVGGTPELVLHEHNGLLVPPRHPKHLADAIVRLLNDSRLREQLGRAGHHRAASLFTMERMLQQTERLYDDIVSTTIKP